VLKSDPQHNARCHTRYMAPFTAAETADMARRGTETASAGIGACPVGAGVGRRPARFFSEFTVRCDFIGLRGGRFAGDRYYANDGYYDHWGGAVRCWYGSGDPDRRGYGGDRQRGRSCDRGGALRGHGRSASSGRAGVEGDTGVPRGRGAAAEAVAAGRSLRLPKPRILEQESVGRLFTFWLLGCSSQFVQVLLVFRLQLRNRPYYRQYCFANSPILS
jgi:hypothetical protein